MRAVVAEARTDPELLRTAPHTMPVGRLDEVAAARNPVLRQRFPGDEPAAGRAGVTAAPRRCGPAVALVELPLLRASGAEQMAVDERLLDEAAALTVRRYLWSPPAVSLGKFQELAPDARSALAAAGIDVVRRPSGGRLVLHGEGFEWSFAVVVPAGLLPYGTHAAYRMVRDAMAAALCRVGRDTRRGPRRALRALGAVLLLGTEPRSAGGRGEGGRRGAGAPRRPPPRARQRARAAPPSGPRGRRRSGDRRALARRAGSRPAASSTPARRSGGRSSPACRLAVRLTPDRLKRRAEETLR